MASTTGASNGGAAEPSNTNAKSITRLLQHSILQLCNEHVGYSHKLQILGVLCMTVDDEQQELVVKVNNTLKRVTPNNPKDNGAQMASHITPSDHHIAHPSTSVRVTQSKPIHESPLQLSLNGSPAGPAVNCITNGYGSSGAERKSHGRKRANPVKVHQVFDEADLGSDEEAPVTVIPEAPETTMSMTSSMSPSPSGGMSIANKTRLISDVKASGSAKRKPSQQFRVPQFTSSPKNPHMRQALSEAASSPFGSETGDTDSNGAQNLSTSSSQGQGGLSLPIFVAGPQQNGVINPIEITPDNCSDSEREDPSRSPSKSPGDLHIDEDNTSVKVKEESESTLNNSFLSPAASGGSDVALDFSRSGLQTMASLYGLTSTSLDGTNLTNQLPFSALNLLTSMRQSDPASAALPDGGDGLTIKYTSTGPYTVGANGKDVSNSSRIKDIIMYDEHSPVNVQKGQKMEQDFIVDKLGMDGRKRRRRAPEDQLTPEEIAEYLGQPDKADFSFKCKYCTEVFDSVTRYIHHTLASHQAYICHQCGKSFTTKSSLLRHRPIHTGMRRFACSICKKTFYRKDKCKAHIKRHLGIDANQTAADNANVMNQFQNLEMAAVELE